MTEPTYSLKEIIELQFKNLGKDIQDIKQTLEKQDQTNAAQFARFDKEIRDLKQEVADLRTEHAKYRFVWGVAATVGAAVIATVSSSLTGRFFQ